MNGDATLRMRFVMVAGLLLLLSLFAWRNERFYEPWEVDQVARFVQPSANIFDLTRRVDPNGSLVLAVEVDRDGMPVRVRRERLEGADQILVDEFAARLLLARFEPAVKAGAPVASVVRLSLNPGNSPVGEPSGRLAGSSPDQDGPRVR